MRAVERGAWSGLIATGPMTLFMFLFQEKLPQSERSPLAPATLTTEIMGEERAKKYLQRSGRENLALISHFGYGAVAGALYSLMASKIKTAPVVKGALYGLALWTTSYMGWIPLAQMRASAFNMPWKRNGMMIFSHLIWGLALASSEEHLSQKSHETLDGVRKKVKAE